MQRIISIFAIFIGLVACGEKGPSAAPASAKAAAPQADPALLARLDALGDGGLLVGVLDARGWAKVHQRLTPVVARLPDGASAEFAQVATLPGLLNTLFKGLFGAMKPLDLAALDADGVVLVSLFEPATAGPPGAAAAQIGLDHAVPLRHEIVLPAADASALAAGLMAGLKGMCKPVAHGCDFGELQVGVKADGDVVRIAALMPATPEDAQAMLWRSAQAPSVRTPALLELARPGAALGLLVRPWRLRAWATQDGVNQMLMALQSAPPDVREKLFAQGLSIVLGGSSLMHAERPDLEDAVMRLFADDAGIAFAGTHSLTAATAKAFETASSKAGRTLALKLPVIAQTAHRVDLNALLDGVGPRPIFAKMKRLRDFAQGLQECGFGCMLHTAFRVPFSTARGALDLAPAEVKAVVRALPTATQAVVVRMQERGRPIVALAGDVAKDFDTGQLRALGDAEIHLIPRDDRAVLLVGIGIDPRTVFDAESTVKPTALSTLRVDPKGLGEAAQLLGAGPITGFFNALGPIAAESVIAPGGQAFAWRLHLSTSPGVKASPFAPAATVPFDGPILGFTPSAGDPCLGALIAGTSEAFAALASMPPEQRGTAIPGGFATMAADLKCAEENPSTKAGAQGVRRLFVQMVGWGAEPGKAADALAFAEAQCAQSKDAWICKEAIRIKSLPPPPAAPVSVETVAEPVEANQLGFIAASPLIAIDVPETRDKSMIQVVIRSNAGQVRYCYEKSLMKDPKLAGKAMVAFTISPEGTIDGVTSAGDTLPAEVHACIVERVKSWAFLPAKTETKVNYPFIFKAQ